MFLSRGNACAFQFLARDQPDRVEKGLRELIVRDAAVGTVFCEPRRAAVSGMIRLHSIGI